MMPSVEDSHLSLVAYSCGALEGRESGEAEGRDGRQTSGLREVNQSPGGKGG